MNPGRFFMPRMASNIAPMISANYVPMRNGIGLFGRISNSLKSFNWNGLLNGANKTLNVVNQTIPLIRQAGPMFNNMKSMMKIARAFGSETNRSSFNAKNNTKIINDNTNYDEQSNNNIVVNSINDEKLKLKKEVQNNNYPNFFI